MSARSSAEHSDLWDAFFSHAAAAALLILLDLSASASLRAASQYLIFSALLITLAWSFFGFGALLIQYPGPWSRPRSALALAAGTTLLTAGALLRAHLATPAGWAFTGTAALLAPAALAFFGAVAAAALRRAAERGRSSAERTVAAAGLGTALGFGLALGAMHSYGVQVSLLAISVATVAYAWRPFLGPLIVAAAFLESAPLLRAAELKLEGLRAAPLEGMPQKFAPFLKRSKLRPQFLYWGNSGQFAEYKLGDLVFLFYNNLSVSIGNLSGNYHGKIRRSPVYDYYKLIRVHDGERILVVGAAGGHHLRDLAQLKRVSLTIVEINDAVVRAYRDHPEHNGGLFLRSRVFARDGRSVLEASPPETYDLAIFEIADSGKPLFNTGLQHMTFVTREALAALDRALRPKGAVIFISTDRHQSLTFAGSARAQGLRVRAYTRALRTVRFSLTISLSHHLYVVIALRPGTQDPLADVDRSGMQAIASEQFLPPLSDTRPSRLTSTQLFASTPKSLRSRNSFLKLAALSVMLGLAFFAVISIGAAPGPCRRRCARPETLFFIRVGAGQMLAYLLITMELCPFLGQTLLTTMAANIGIGVAAAAGNLAAGRLRDHRRSAWPLAAAFVLALAASVSMSRSIRLTGPDMAIPWLNILCATAPLGVVMGVFFPLGLRLIKPADLGTALAADAAGALAGLGLHYCLLMQFGTGILPWVCVAAYLSACRVLSKTDAIGESAH